MVRPAVKVPPKKAILCSLKVFIRYNNAYLEFKIANERICISLILGMASGRFGGAVRRDAARLYGKRDARHHPTPRASRPKPRAFFSCPKPVQVRFAGFSPAPVQPGQGQSNLVRAGPAARHPGPETRNGGQSSPVNDRPPGQIKTAAKISHRSRKTAGCR